MEQLQAALSHRPMATRTWHLDSCCGERVNLTGVRVFASAVLWVLALALLSPGAADGTTSGEDLMNMDLEELLQIEISVASKKAEPLTEAPGIVSVD